MKADELRAAMETVLLEALRRNPAGGETASTTRSWAQNGGSSLEAYAAIMRIEQELGVVVPVARVLGPRPLSDLLDEAASAGPEPQAQVAEAPAGAVPATASQRRHWRHAQGDGSAAFLNIGRAMYCSRDFDADKAEAAFRALVARHESLRNRYVMDAAGQLLLDEVPDWPEKAEFARHPRAASAEDANAVIRAEVGRTFPLGQEPPVRGGCVPLEDGTGIVYFSVHHITADGWSVDLLAGDFLALYSGAGGELPEATPFSRYAGTLDARARAGVYADDIAYWREKFARVSPDFTIAGRDGEASGQRAGTAQLVWDGPGEADAVRAAARTLGVTTYSLMLSSLLAAAHVMSGEDNVVVMSGVANRNRADYRETAGLFTNQIFFVGDFGTPGGTTDYVRQVHADVVESLGRSELPVEVVLDELGAYAAARTLAPYANILFQAAEAPIAPPAMRDGSWRTHPLGTGSIKRHCNIHLLDTGAELALELDYSLALVGERDAGRLLRAIRSGVDHIVAAAHSSVAELVEVVGKAAGERQEELTVFTVDYPGARAEPALAAVVREAFPEVAVVELPVPRSLEPQEIEDCLRRCHDTVSRARGPRVLLSYCSASVWARHLVQTLAPQHAGGALPLLSVSGNTKTEQDWVEEFAELIGRFDAGTDLSALAPERVAIPRTGSLVSRCAAAEGALTTMRRLMEAAMKQRFGDPLGRVARETMEVQLSWMAYLGSCVVLGTLTDAQDVEELSLPESRLDDRATVEDWLRPVLDRLGRPAAGTVGEDRAR
ncbi:condensation domain-containing protein [Streptomyces sp. NPDC015127]|uniref:condensation domain-containing protein n=1 Tax=Streptomyces sp. NPDC015127 TaxID=3364939 RepID=UPI0037031FD0